MKKRIFSIVAALVLFVGVGTGCTSKTGNKTIKIGASPTPHAEILEKAKPLLQQKGYDLDIKEYTDYVLPNTATQEGELDANYFQHQPYLMDFNQQNGTTLVSVGMIHYEPFGIYAGKTKTLADLPNNATISVPNDTTNEARALQLLEAEGLIKLKEGVDLRATILDIVENPKNIQIKEIEAAQLARTLKDVDLAVINGNYAISAGLKVLDALAIEDKNSPAAKTMANILVVKEGRQEDVAIQALIEVLQSAEIKTFIEENYEGAVIPLALS